MEVGRGYRTAQPTWLGGDMEPRGRPPAYIILLNQSFIVYDGRRVGPLNTVLDHYDVIDGPAFEWSAAITMGGHDFGIKVQQRPNYLTSPDIIFKVLMVDNFGGAAIWRYDLDQEVNKWGLFGIELNNPHDIEVSGFFERFALFSFLPCPYSQEPA